VGGDVSWFVATPSFMLSVDSNISDFDFRDPSGVKISIRLESKSLVCNRQVSEVKS
jgi:hypothetical protein